MSRIHRRQFLSQSVRSAAALSVAFGQRHALLSAAAKPYRMTIDLTPGAIGVEAKHPARLNALAMKHGFTSVAPNVSALATMSDVETRKLLDRMKTQGLRWGSAGCPVRFNGDQAIFDAGLKQLPQYAKALQKVGASRVNTWIPPSSDRYTYRLNFALQAGRLREIAKVLKDHGQRLGLEYIGTHTLLIQGKYPFLHTMAETKELIAEIGTGNVGFVLDSWHWWQAGDTAEQILTLQGDEIIAVDLNDAPRGVEKRAQLDHQRELPASTGVINVKAFLNAVHQTGFDGPVRAEPFNALLRKMNDDDACAATAAALKKAFALID